MPYIEPKNRPKFAANLKSVISVIVDNQESWYNRGDYFGYFVNRLVKNWVGDTSYQDDAFNSASFMKEKRQALANAADSLAQQVGKSDPLGSAGDLNYCISLVYWALLGEKKDIPRASYGLRAYLKGFLVKISQNVVAQTRGAGVSNADLAKAFRREIVAKGVLDDVADEAYRVLTVPYEEEKLFLNGNLWPMVTEWRQE
jgi:hypothetical protein